MKILDEDQMLDSTPGSSRVEIRNDGGSGGKRGGISNGEVLQTQHQTFPTVAKSLSYVLEDRKLNVYMVKLLYL